MRADKLLEEYRYGLGPSWRKNEDEMWFTYFYF